jgi:hypothetical protein
MVPAALRTTGADTTAFSGVGRYTGAFPSPRRLAFPQNPSGYSPPTRKLVPLLRPASRSVRLTNPARPYDTRRAFHP